MSPTEKVQSAKDRLAAAKKTALAAKKNASEKAAEAKAALAALQAQAREARAQYKAQVAAAKAAEAEARRAAKPATLVETTVHVLQDTNKSLTTKELIIEVNRVRGSGSSTAGTYCGIFAAIGMALSDAGVALVKDGKKIRVVPMTIN